MSTDYPGTPREQTKAKLLDPSGNAIEIKTYVDPSTAFEPRRADPPRLPADVTPVLASSTCRIRTYATPKAPRRGAGIVHASPREHRDVGGLDRGPDRAAFDDAELAQRGRGDLGDQRHRAADPHPHAVAEQLDALDRARPSRCAGCRPARSRCSATERGWITASDVAGPGAGHHDRARRSASSTRSPSAGAASRFTPTSSATYARARPGGDVGERAGLHDAAVLEDDEPVGERGRVERIVGHEEPDAGERRELAAQVAPHRAARALVERGERLVEQEEPRLGRQRPRERDALGLPAGELARLHRRAVGEPDRVERTRAAAPRAARRLAPRLRSPNATFSSTVRCGNSR